MLQFWKKSDRKLKVKNNYVDGSPKVQITNNNRNTHANLDQEIVHLNQQNDPYVPRSRLSKTLSEVLADKDALGYFIQFMDSKSSLALIKFWLDIESFRSATICQNDEILLSHEEDCSIISNSTELNTPVDQMDEVFENDRSKSVNNQNNINNKKGGDEVFENDHNNTNDQNNFQTNIGDACEFTKTRRLSENDDIKQEFTKCRLNSTQSDFSKCDGDNISMDSLYLTAESENENNRPYEFKKCSRKLGSLHSLHNDKNNIKECNGTDNFKCEIKRTYSVPQNFYDIKRSISVSSLRKLNNMYTSIFQDAVRISKKYISDNAPYHVKLPDFIKNEILNKIRNNFLDPEIFTTAQDTVYVQMEQNYFNQFLRSDFNTKYQIDVLTSGNVILEDILFNETALFHFMEFLEQELPVNRDFIEFWLSAVNFRQSVSNDMEQIQSDAMTLYDKYFSLQAINPLNLGDEVRFHVEQNICREEGPAMTSFDLPLKIVQSYLEKNYLKPFLMSQLFFNYLTELINSIHSSPWPKFRHKKTGSDASSEISVSNKVEKNKKKSKFDMSIETSNMTDPDSLWRRKQIGLKFGRVNELGRFQSDLEREPENKSNWKFSVKRFVNKKDVTKEEMAWQVAEMIVKDITSLTLNGEINDECS